MKVLVALSGGVDSSVAAAVLRETGHDVVGATMKLWGGESDSGCCSVNDVEDARRSAAQLGIDHHVFNWTDEFERHVVEPYVASHALGRTPNPCVECNRHLKFDAFMERADLLGFDAVATGHHARVVTATDGRRRVARGADPHKDQSYVLHPLRSEALERVMFPIGSMTKAEVRSRAADLGLRTAHKAESQDVCFVTRADGREAFLGDRIALHPARVLDESGEQVGSVDAVETITIGQRRGLRLAGGSERRFVTSVDIGGRTVTVGPPGSLDDAKLHIEQMVWAHDPVEGVLEVQCSAHGKPRPATVEPIGDAAAVIRWDTPQRRVAAGQSVVLYEGDTVVGGGSVTG